MTDQEQTTQIELLKQAQKTMSEKLDELKTLVVKGFDDIAEKMEKTDEKNEKKFASKFTEKVVYGMAGVMLLAILKAIIDLVLK